MKTVNSIIADFKILTALGDFLVGNFRTVDMKEVREFLADARSFINNYATDEALNLAKEMLILHNSFIVDYIEFITINKRLKEIKLNYNNAEDENLTFLKDFVDKNKDRYNW